MIRYVLRRLLWMIPIMLGVLLLVFTISYFTPGDPVMNMLGSNYTEEAYIAKTIELGLDKPFIVQYATYVWNLVTKFDMGTSYSYGHSISGEIITRMGTTLKLGLLSITSMVILGILTGIVSAIKQYSLIDYIITTLSMVFAAMPGFWLALMLILIFALNLGWFPATGQGGWKFMVLPVVSSCMSGVATVSRMTRSSMLEVIRQDYIRTARAKGLSEGTIIRKHALKNALIPVMTIVGMQLGSIMGGSVIIESIFTIPGMGMYLMTGISTRDYPVINACVLVISMCVCIMNLVVDLCYAYVDPRIKAQYENAGRKRIKTKKSAGKEESK